MRDVLSLISAPDVSPSGASVTIALIDSGIYSEHPDIKPAIQGQVTCLDDGDLVDRSHHGTHLAGIICGRGLLEVEACRGVAPESKILSYKIIDNDPAGQERFDVLTLIKALHEAVSAGADIINLAVTCSRFDAPSPPWAWPQEEALMGTLRYVAQKGVLCVVAAGNDGPDVGTINFPAGSPHVLTVGAIAADGTILPFSSRGPYLIDPNLQEGLQETTSLLNPSLQVVEKPDLVVPGSEIWAPHSEDCQSGERVCVTRNSGRYVRESGTSQATAVACGLAACAIEYLSARQVVLGANRASILCKLMIEAARMKPGPESYGYGAGILTWPSLQCVLDRFNSDPQFRSEVSLPREPVED